MEHSIYTSFGNSESKYRGLERRLPPHGTIQCNGASPLICTATSIVLFLALKQKKYGGNFHAPITKMACFAYVDDTDLLQTKQHKSDTIGDILDELQGSIYVWQGILRASGGTIDHDDPNKIY